MTAFFSHWKGTHYSRSDLITLFRITRRTLYNWLYIKAPPHATAAMAILAGDLTPHGFERWTIRTGQLHAPNGHSFTPREIESIPLLYAELAAYRTANDEYRRRLPPCITIKKRPAANDDHKPEQLPVFTDDHIYFD